MKYGTKSKRNKWSSWKNNRKRRKTTNKQLFDEECQLILEDRKTAYNKMINRNAIQNKQEYKDKRKEAHKLVDKKKDSNV